MQGDIRNLYQNNDKVGFFLWSNFLLSEFFIDNLYLFFHSIKYV